MNPCRILLSGLLAIAPISAFCQAPNAPAHDPRIPALLHDLAQAHGVRETALSPDGKQIAWNDGQIKLASLADTAHPRVVTPCPANAPGPESGLAWSPDSKTLAFFSSCTPDHKNAIFTSTGSGAPRQLAALNGFSKDLVFSPDGKSLSFLYVEGATRPSGALAAMKPFSGVIGVEGLEVQRVAAVDASSGALSQLTPAGLHVYEFSWSEDAKQLTYVAAPPPGENNWWVAKLFTQTIGSEPKVVFDPATASGPIHGLQIAVPRFSPDGKQIAFIAGLMSDQGSTGGDIYSIPASGGEATDLTPDRDASPAWFQWLNGKQLGIAEIKNAKSHLFVWNLDTHTESTQSNLTLPASIGSGSLEMQVSIADNGTIAFTQSSFEHPPEVWAGRIGDLKQITHLNDGLKPSWGRSEAVSWTNEGFHVDGWLLYPANYDPAKKYGLVVYVHGGPSAANMPRWPGAGFGAAPFSALGYFVLLPNPRGSFGEGEKFTQANRKDFGYGDLRDIVAGVDAVAASHPVDPQRVGITGWSYGGFMTMFAVTQTHRFHAAVAGAGLSNWQSYYGENSIDQWMIPFFGASVYDDPAVYAKSSAINYIKNVQTPTLVVVGDRDGECPAPQSFEFWHALRDQHVPTQLVVYPDEGHGFTNPEHRVDVLERALAWFDQYLR
ncbi:prolyl oligopeptidase family serine peptidase [Silvibacterium sp.]|uniref:S9 family peptidase n=1 Tax=Silvibacterium sp. TaxID=1964179 RepID=UPI0039E6606C